MFSMISYQVQRFIALVIHVNTLSCKSEIMLLPTFKNTQSVVGTIKQQSGTIEIIIRTLKIQIKTLQIQEQRYLLGDTRVFANIV